MMLLFSAFVILLQNIFRCYSFMSNILSFTVNYEQNRTEYFFIVEYSKLVNIISVGLVFRQTRVKQQYLNKSQDDITAIYVHIIQL